MGKNNIYATLSSTTFAWFMPKADQVHSDSISLFMDFGRSIHFFLVCKRKSVWFYSDCKSIHLRELITNSEEPDSKLQFSQSNLMDSINRVFGPEKSLVSVLISRRLAVSVRDTTTARNTLDNFIISLGVIRVVCRGLKSEVWRDKSTAWKRCSEWSPLSSLPRKPNTWKSNLTPLPN
jgi:hypothetical protein